jgi:ABC-type amino acid transport substrate-binding protein
MVLLRRALLLLLVALHGGPARAATAPPLRLSSTDADATTLVSALVLQEAYAALGRNFVLRAYPPALALRATNDGQVDGALHRIAGLERNFPDLLRVPVAINRTEPIAVVKRRDIRIEDWSSLGNYRVGIVRSIVVYEQRTAGMDVTRLENLDQLLGMLDRNRLDVVVDDRLDVLEALRNPAFRDLRAQDEPIEAIPLYHYLHKRHRDLLPKLKAALAKMQRSGRIQAIRNDVILRLQRGDPLPPMPAPVEQEAHDPSPHAVP